MLISVYFRFIFFLLPNNFFYMSVVVQCVLLWIVKSKEIQPYICVVWGYSCPYFFQCHNFASACGYKCITCQEMQKKGDDILSLGFQILNILPFIRILAMLQMHCFWKSKFHDLTVNRRARLQMHQTVCEECRNLSIDAANIIIVEWIFVFIGQCRH